jgi:18S rRNA (guanine1575-N7)-methyltransferase
MIYVGFSSVTSSRMIDIQVQMSERAIELLALPDDEPHLLLDLGCGSGLSGSVLEDRGHMWVGIDISSAMLGMFLQILLWSSNMSCKVCV